MFLKLVQKSHFIILGASLDTGNLGVSALMASTVKGIISVCPEAQISLLEGQREPILDELSFVDGKKIKIGCIGVRQNKTVWRRNHILHLLLIAIIARLIVVKSWRQKWLRSNPYIRQIMDAQFVADITGGDSFSDIYGFRRLVIGTLFKILPILLGTKFVLLPQTYGPFKSKLSRYLARWSIRRVDAVYSRDQEGLGAIRQLIGKRTMKAKSQFCPDVAFLLDAIRPDTEEVRQIEILRADGQRLIGINISGLLYNGGYTQNNMFGLKSDYKELVAKIILKFLEEPDTVILLVPHVFPSDRLAVESDPVACQMIYNQLHDSYPDQLYCLEGKYDQSEIKFIIGLCDFFIGSRMHACIAALSQGIPAVGLAYSKKFQGVFKSVGVSGCVIDTRSEMAEGIVKRTMSLFSHRSQLAEQLYSAVPQAQKILYSAFQNICVGKY